MPEREVKHLDVVGFEPRPVAWQESSLSIAPWPLGQYKMDYMKREWPLYNGRGSTAPPNLSHCGGEDTRGIRKGFELRTFLHCS